MKKTSLTPPTSSTPPISALKPKNSKHLINRQPAKVQNGILPKRSLVGKTPLPASPPGVNARKQSYLSKLEQSELSGSGLSQAEAEDLAGKFAELSKSIVELARSRDSLGLRALETLLSREISLSLGPALNHPKFSEGFIRATRSLLDNLVTDYELGKVNPNLIKTDGNDILKADSSTTLSYRDKYFKELVINMLQIVCSSNTEEDETDKKSVRSAESQERIQAIRKMVREELGIAPDACAELELRIKELRQSVIEIATEQGKALTIPEPLDHLKIPSSARNALRSSCEGRKGSPSLETRGADNKGNIRQSQSISYSGSSLNKNSHEISGVESSKECAGGGCVNKEDVVAMMKQELLGTVGNNSFIRKNKKKYLLKERYSSEKCIDPLESYSRRFDIESAFDDENDDSITEAETRAFLEAWKADVEKRNRVENKSDEKTGAGSVDKKGSESNIVHSVISKNNFLDVRDTDEHILLDDQTGNFDETIKHIKESLSICSLRLSLGEERWPDINGRTVDSEKRSEDHKQNNEIANTTKIDKLKSRFWLSEAPSAEQIVKEMQAGFGKFNLLTEDTFNQLKANESKLFTRPLQSAKEEQISRCSVKEFGLILNKICKHIRLLPITFDVDNPGFLERRKTRAFGILIALEKCFRINESNMPNDSDPIFPLNDKEKFTQSVKRGLLAFSNLAAIIERLPADTNNMPISALDPPQNLIKAMTVLYHADYFRDCFIQGPISWPKEDFKSLDDVKSVYDLSSESFKTGGVEDNLDTKQSVHCRTSDKEKSSHTSTRSHRLDWFERGNLKNSFISVKSGASKSLGSTSSNVTVQNLSDMFLQISTILNDVPDSLKESKFVTLNPPDSLNQVVGILYCSDSAEFIPEYVKKKSLASLTVQNTADFFLTLSSIFHRAPERVKNSPVKELDPPKSLTKAMQLLNSLSNSTIQERLIQKVEPSGETEEQEHFFDAAESFNHLTA